MPPLLVNLPLTRTAFKSETVAPAAMRRLPNSGNTPVTEDAPANSTTLLPKSIAASAVHTPRQRSAPLAFIVTALAVPT